MSREFAQYEMRKSKCPVCGCRNKIFTRFVDKQTREKVGHTITCCNCGGVKSFFKDVTKNGLTPIYTSDEFEPDLQRCFQLSGCPHKTDCKLYGTSCEKLASGCFGDCVNCTDQNCGTGDCSNDGSSSDSNNACNGALENPLNVHIHNTPRFL